MEGRQEPVRLVKQPTRIFYNSSRKGSRELSRKQCNWCGRAGHVERDCWTKKGVCNWCGEGKHLLTECSKYVPRIRKRLFVPKCPACGGEYCGRDCPHRASSLSDLSSSSTTSDIVASRHTRMTCKVLDKRYGSGNCDFSDTSCYSREFQQINQSTVAQSKTEQEEQLLDDSVCFKSKDKIPNYVLEDSLIFKSEPRTFNDKFYQMCPTIQSDTSDGSIREQSGDEMVPSSSCLPGNCGRVLTADDKTWDVSSIENSEGIDLVQAGDLSLSSEEDNNVTKHIVNAVSSLWNDGVVLMDYQSTASQLRNEGTEEEPTPFNYTFDDPEKKERRARKMRKGHRILTQKGKNGRYSMTK